MSEVFQNKMVLKCVVIKLKCDSCDVKADISNTKDWGVVKAYHQGWDSDSAESNVKYDCCSAGCYLGLLHKVLVEFEDEKKTATINDMSYALTKSIVELLTQTETK